MSNLDLFTRLSDRAMQPEDVTVCLKMPQHEFLNMLADGVSFALERSISRAELAAITETTPKSMYSYFASPSARDYRSLSDEMRIAMIWRTVKKHPLSDLQKNKKIKAQKPGTKKRLANLFLVNGKPLTLREAAPLLGYSGFATLYKRISKENIPPGGDISHCRVKKAEALYIINGTKVSMPQAASHLGYSHAGLFRRLQKDGIPAGADITHLTRINKIYKKKEQ